MELSLTGSLTKYTLKATNTLPRNLVLIRKTEVTEISIAPIESRRFE